MENLLYAFTIPFITWGAHQGLEELKKYRAKKRLKNDPLFRVGAEFISLESEEAGKPLLGNGTIKAFGHGYVHVTGITERGTPIEATFTCREFERLTPLWVK